jgi:hypothetical protein
MPRWLLGGVLGIVTAGFDMVAAQREKLSTRNIVVLMVVRIAIGFIIGLPTLYALPRHFRWIRGMIISVILSIPVAILSPEKWQSIMGFGIAYGAIIGYLVDRILPLNTEKEDL